MNARFPLSGAAAPAVWVFLLALWGLLTIASSQSGTAEPLRLAGKQLGFLGVGLAVMAAAAAVPFRLHSGKWLPYYAAAAFAGLWLLPFFGVRINGMRGWYACGALLLQPSELGKGIVLLLAAALLARPLPEWKRAALLGLLLCGWTAPIIRQPDFGTAAVYLLGFAALYHLAGGARRYLAVGGAAAAAVLVGFLIRHPYALRRITAFWNPDSDPSGSGWHIRQLQLALAHGHWTGTRLGRAVWSNAYLPLAYNDSAYATMAETLGFVGAAAALAGFAFLVWQLFHRSLQNGLPECARHYLAGAALLIAIQTLLHLSVNVGLLPPTGLTLPLISYGGSSLVGTCFLIGLAISASRAAGETASPESSQ